MLHSATATVQPPTPALSRRAAAATAEPGIRLLPLVLAVLLGHVLLLELLQPGGVVGASHPGSKPLLRSVRVVAPALAPATVPSSVDAVGSAAPQPTPRRSPAAIGADTDTDSVAVPRSRPRSAADATAPAPPTQRRDPAAAALPASATSIAATSGGGADPQVATEAPAAAPAGDADGANQAVADSVPVYPTQLPPAAELHFDVIRGAARGRAALRWLPGPAGYLLTLEGDASPALRWLDWRSQGGVDAAGIAPDRYTDRRRGRDLRAANFQRDKGLLTYSGPAVEQALLPGAQDRLSWMLQLTAIVQADPARAAPGARTTLFVTGARGDADVWMFVVEGVEAVDTAVARIDGAVHLRRVPRRPYDTLVDVWLDPDRSHLPARVRLATQQSAAAAVEFVLRDIAVP